MKEKFLKEAQGAVAIFLVLVLVPMMTVSCLFIDMSRVKLAEAVVDSAGDLTLNSALTQYDSLLQEYYGLFATSQSIDEVLSRMDEYFIKCIKSAGINDSDAQLLSSKLINSFSSQSGGGITDILNIVVDEPDFSMERTPGGSICNPTLLKSQVVNFMKYRAPINGGLALLSSLKSFSNLSKETELIEKRQEYYEAEKEVNTKCKEAWQAINSYNSCDCCTNEQFYTNLSNNFSRDNGKTKATGSFYQTYRKVISDAYGYIYISNNKKTGDNLNFTNPVSTKPVTVSQSYPSGQTGKGNTFTWYYMDQKCVYSSFKIEESFGGNKYNVRKDDANSKITVNTTQEYELTKAIEEAYKYLCQMNRLAGKVSSLDDSIVQTRSVYYRVENNAEYSKAAKNFCNAMQTLEHCYRWVASDNLADGYATVDGSCASGNSIKFTTADLNKNYTAVAGDKKTQSLSSWYKDLLEKFLDNKVNGYIDFADKLKDDAEDARKQYADKLSSINNSLGTVSSTIVKYSNELKKASDYLKTASRCLGEIAEEVQKGGALSNAKGAWSKSAEGLSDASSIAAQDKAEIQNIAKQFKPEDIYKLKSRIDEIKKNIDLIIAELDNFKFGGTPLSKITTYDSLCGPLHGVATKNKGQVFNPQSGGDNGKPLSQTTTIGDEDKQLGQAEEILREGYKTGNISIKWVDQQSSCPFLKQHILSFYIYLYKNFNKTGDYNQITDKNNNDLKTEKIGLEDNGESAKKDIENKGSNGKNAVKEKKDTSKGANDITGKTLPSKSPIERIDGKTSNNNVSGPDNKEIGAVDSSNAATNAKDSSASLFSGIGKWLSDMGAELRDNIYMTEYVMDMFSYDTIEYSGNSTSKKNGSKYTDLKSLTCEGINAQNNLAFKSEIEYILYGGTNTKNVATAYATIYGVRLAFNLIYAFTNSELRNAALAIATPISAATMGVVPIPLIQYGLLTAAALAESGIDLSDLKDGKKLPLYKSEKTWHISLSYGISSIMGGVAGDVVRDISDDIIDAGANKLSDLLDKTDDELKNLNGDALNGINKQIDDAFENVFDEQINAVANELSSLIMTSIQDGASKAGNIDIQNTSQYVKTQLKKWNSNDNSAGLVKEIRDAAVDYLLTNGSVIDSLSDEINKAVGDVSNVPQAVAEALEIKLGDVKSNMRKFARTKLDFSKYIDEAKKSAQEAIASGADKLKESINGTIDKLGGSNSSSDVSATSASASLFSFGYREYLELFLLINFMTNEQKTLLRMADVIQVNMAKVSGNDGYLLKNASCYLTLTCTTYVKPLFLAVPFIADTANVSLDGKDGKRTFCFKYEYKKVKGY